MPTLCLIHGDVRHEQMSRVGSSLARFGSDLPEVPSPNLKRVLDSIDRGELGKLSKLVAKIEAGDASSDETEQEQVYDGLGTLFGYIEDLVAMCLRREQALAECDVKIGG